MPAGKFADAVLGGRVFSVSTVVAGVAIPISSTTAPIVMVWNPLDSGVYVNFLRYVVGWASGTSVPSTVGYQTMSVGGGGLSAATGAAISAFTPTPVRNALVGGGAMSKVRASAQATNGIVAVVNWTTMGIELATGAATSVNPPGAPCYYDFDGLFQMAPGTAMFTCGNAASGSLMQQSLYWEEVPVY